MIKILAVALILFITMGTFAETIKLSSGEANIFNEFSDTLELASV